MISSPYTWAGKERYTLTDITLDDNTARRLALSDPDLFFETYKAPLIIDEFLRQLSVSGSLYLKARVSSIYFVRIIMI